MQRLNSSQLRRIVEIRINRDYVFLVLIIIIGTLFRLFRLGYDLAPDAVTYRSLAMQILQGSYVSGREPIFPLTVAAVFLVFGDSVITMKMTTLSMSILMALLTYRIG